MDTGSKIKLGIFFGVLAVVALLLIALPVVSRIEERRVEKMPVVPVTFESVASHEGE